MKQMLEFLTKSQVAEARLMLAKGFSLTTVASVMNTSEPVLDLALWNLIGVSCSVRPTPMFP